MPRTPESEHRRLAAAAREPGQPALPRRPVDGECCERGCDPCVWDDYERALARWRERHELSFEIFEGAPPLACLELRKRIFIEEQGVDERDEIDGRDPECLHFLVTQGERPVACGRLRPLGGPRAKVERVAVAASLRRSGVGRRVMQAMEAEAMRRAWPELRLHAQLQSLDFYRRLGWSTVGEAFEEAGIAHREMVKRLQPDS